MPGTEIYEELDAIRSAADRITELYDGYEPRSGIAQEMFDSGESGEGLNGVIAAFYSIERMETTLRFTLKTTSDALRKVAQRLEDDQELISNSFQGDNI